MSGNIGIDHSTARSPRGDRARRRHDVLTAATAVLEELGWDGFSIREVASRAGVSAGAVYQWFSGKGEIWAHLLATRFGRDTVLVESWDDDFEPAELVRRVISVIAANHRDLGRYRFDFVKGLDHPVPEYAGALTAAFHALNDAIAARLTALVPASVSEAERRARLSWIWAMGKGVGDHLVDARHDTFGVDEEVFLATTATCALAGLSAP